MGQGEVKQESATPARSESSDGDAPGTRVRKPSRATVRYPKFRVLVARGPNQGLQQVGTGQKSLRVGTGADSDLRLSDATVSRQHCELEVTDAGIRVRDAQSTNGVFARGARVFDAVFETEVELSLGDTALRVTPLAQYDEKQLSASDRFGRVLGGSARMRTLFAELELVAPTDVPVLIEGETGTGKELVAEAIHEASPRAQGPFVVLDCTTLVPTLAGSELFGHEKDSFNGAKKRIGLFEKADGGTIFLDEIGELPKDLQPQLLRVLQERQVRPVGDSRVRPVDIRVIAATHRNLAEEVRRGQFREDLFFRLAVAHVIVPPLRDRLEDLPQLVEHFLSRQKPPRSASEVTPEAWEMLRSNRWRGNVRELQNALLRWALAPDRLLRGAGISQEASADDAQRAPAARAPSEDVPPYNVARREAIDEFERDYASRVLALSGGNISRAAAFAGMSRQMLQKVMRKHDIPSREPGGEL